MAATTVGFVSERLTQARKARGLTAVTLAELLGVTSTTISQYEHGKQAPRPELMTALSAQLGIPPSLLLRPIRTITQERRTKWRSNTSATKFARERAESRFEWLCEIVQYFEQYLDFPAVNVPSFELPVDFREITVEMIDRSAAWCREYWGIGNAPIQDLILLLENNGIIVSRGKLNADDLSAFSEWLDNDYPYVFLGTDKNVCVRSRFDAAHELGHLVLHKRVPKKQYGTPADFKLLEKQAHRFAAAFLLPKESFFRDLWAPTLDVFVALKPRWKVSVKGMIVHSHRHQLLSDTQYQRMMINYNRRWKEGEPLDDVMEPESPRMLARCVETLVEQKVKNREEILLDLSFAAHDIEELVGLPMGYFNNNRAELIRLPTPQLREDVARKTTQGVVVPFNRNS